MDHHQHDTIEGDVDLLEAGFPGVVHVEHRDKSEESEEQEFNFMKSHKLIGRPSRS